MKVFTAKYKTRYDSNDILAIDEGIVQTQEELDLAFALAKESFKNKKNISNKFKYEFLLWLTGKTDLSSAFLVSKPKEGENCLVICFDNSKLPNGKPAKLKKGKIQPLALERISLSRVKN